MGVELYSNEDTKALIKSLINKGREPHSIVICGDKGQGKKAMARYIGASMLCEENKGEPCGQCKSCRMLSKGVHPDFIVVQANENGNYQVDVIREMVADAVTKPNEGKYKVYLIPDLDRSANTAVQVQNILLKLIEEPPAHCIIILTAVSKEIFLETVISRVLSLRTTPCETEEIRGFLSGLSEYTEQEINKATAFGRGNIGRCADFLTDPVFSQAMAVAEKCAESVYSNDEYGFLKALFECDGKKAMLRQTLLFLQEIFRGACILRVGGKDNTGCFSQQTRRLSEKLSERLCMEIYEAISRSIIKLSSNANQTLTANALAAEIFQGN